ncbi:MAG: hypothetical protein EOO38_09750 [Cytophagaceae bacterium]|nr:MAG: hypothetical protein EOO38_09750 [Cytophagaceae bacterium]
MKHTPPDFIMVRPISPFEEDENTRLHLQTEYDPHAPAPRPKPSKKKSLTPRTDRLISRIRLFLRYLSFILSGSIVGFVAYTVWLYRKTEHDYELDHATHAEVRVWPTTLKTQPTYMLLGVSCAATLLNLIIIVASFNKTVGCAVFFAMRR